MSTSPRDDELPSPETDILKSKFFMHFRVSGGPHLDALLYNQATIMKLIQDIRLIQSRGIGTGTSTANIRGEQAGERSTPRFAEEVQELLKNNKQTEVLSGILKDWLDADKTNNKVAGNRGNSNLAKWAKSWWQHCKDKLAAYWDRDADQFDLTDSDEKFYSELMVPMKVIRQSAISIEELFFQIGRIVTKKPPPTGTKRTRTSGGAAAAAAAAAATGSAGPSTATPSEAPEEENLGDSSEEITDGRRGKKRVATGRNIGGGDATEEVSDDGGLGYDDIYEPGKEKEKYLQATIRRKAKDKRIMDVLEQVQASGMWGELKDVVTEEDEDEVTRARLASLNIG